MYITRPIVHALGASACLKMVKGNREVSVAFDDSCGVMTNLGRADIRLYVGDANVTTEVFPLDEYGSTVRADLETMALAMAWLAEDPPA